MKKIITIIAALVIILSNTTATLAKERIIEASGEYVMDSRLNETPASATARAREEAKRIATESAGVYLKTYTKMVNFELETDEVQTIAAQLLKIQEETSNVEVVEKNLLKFTVTIKAVVDEVNDAVLKSMMEDKEKLEELTRKNKELQEKYDALNRQMKKYRQEFDTAGEWQKEEIKKEVARNSEKFSAIDYFVKGNELSLRKDYMQALEAYDEAIKMDEQLAEAYNNRGILKYELGQYSEALDDYTSAIKLKSNYVEALINRGNSWAALKEYQNAAKDLQAALLLDDKSATGHNNLGSLYLSQKKYEESIREYTRAIQLNPNFAEAYYNRAIAYYGQGNLSNALTDARKANILNPNDPVTKSLKIFYESLMH